MTPVGQTRVEKKLIFYMMGILFPRKIGPPVSDMLAAAICGVTSALGQPASYVRIGRIPAFEKTHVTSKRKS